MTVSSRRELARYFRNLEEVGWIMARVDMVGGHPNERLVHVRFRRDTVLAPCEPEDLDVCPTCGRRTSELTTRARQ